MKRILLLALLIVVALSSTACDKNKGYLTSVMPVFEDEIQRESGIDVAVSYAKKGKFYDVRVDFEGLLKENPEWEKASHERRLAILARYSSKYVGFTAGPMKEGGHINFRNLLIGYGDEVWAVPIEFAYYISGHAFAYSMSVEQQYKELLENMERIE